MASAGKKERSFRRGNKIGIFAQGRIARRARPLRAQQNRRSQGSRRASEFEGHFRAGAYGNRERAFRNQELEMDAARVRVPTRFVKFYALRVGRPLK
jgi:hypothetical protein